MKPQTQKMVDFYHDAGGDVFTRIQAGLQSHGKELPPFIVGHRAMTEKEHSSLAPGEFAAPAQRLFPISSKAETWKSLAYYGVLKSASLTPASAADREGIRTMLAKAASLWGLDDDQVAELAHDVTLTIPKTAESESPVAAIDPFLAKAMSMDEPARREGAGLLLKAAEAEELDPERMRQMLVHAGEATCTAGEAAAFLSKLVPKVPLRSDHYKPLSALRDHLRHTASSDILDPDDVNEIVGIVEVVDKQYHLKVSASESLRRLTLADAVEVVEDSRDVVALPGGIMARKSAMAENSEMIGNHLSNVHGIATDNPAEVMAELLRLSPIDIVPLRPLIGA